MKVSFAFKRGRVRKERIFHDDIVSGDELEKAV